jgi:hypothetical protein
MGVIIGAGLVLSIAFFYYFWKRGNIERRASELLKPETGLELSEHEAQMLATDEFSDSQTSYWMAAIFGPIGIAIIVLGWQVLTWLQTAAWPELPISILYSEFGLHEPVLSWVGAQKILDWLENLSLSMGLFGIALFVAFLFTRHDNKPVAEELRTARMKRARSFSQVK